MPQRSVLGSALQRIVSTPNENDALTCSLGLVTSSANASLMKEFNVTATSRQPRSAPALCCWRGRTNPTALVDSRPEHGDAAA